MRASNPLQPVPLCSVLELRRGARAVVRSFEGTDAAATRALARRLVAMGLPIGSETEVLVQRGRGPVLLRALGVRIALGRDEARCVRVEVPTALDTPSRVEAGAASAGLPSAGLPSAGLPSAGVRDRASVLLPTGIVGSPAL